MDLRMEHVQLGLTGLTIRIPPHTHCTCTLCKANYTVPCPTTLPSPKCVVYLVKSVKLGEKHMQHHFDDDAHRYFVGNRN